MTNTFLKSIFFAAIIFISCTKNTVQKLEDGIYLVNDEISDTLHIRELNKNERLIAYNTKLTNDDPKELSKVIVDANQYVALRLKKMPDKVIQPDQRTMLLLNFKDDQAKRLEEFTGHNIMKRVAIVIGNEAVSIHKIRTSIIGGKLQITRCTDNACEKLYYELENDVR